MTHLYFIKEKREKKGMRKKNPPEFNHHIIVHTRGSNRKITARRFQHYP
jgi:hypothetical protein